MKQEANCGLLSDIIIHVCEHRDSWGQIYEFGGLMSPLLKISEEKNST